MEKCALAETISKISRKEFGLMYYSAGELEKIINENRAIFFEESGKPAAFGGWTFREKGWVEVHTLYIWPEFRGKGYLRKVFQEIYNRLKNQATKALFFTFAPGVKHVAIDYNFRRAFLTDLPIKILWRIFIHRIHPKRWPSYLKYLRHPFKLFAFRIYILTS
jgi:GNAT superfamily N-acetyltransferase